MTAVVVLHTTRGQVVGTIRAVALTITGALPAFLTSAMAVQMRDDLHLGPAALGIGTSILFAVSGVMSQVTGRLVQRRGIRVGYAGAAGSSAVSLAVIGVAPSYPVLVLGLAIGGIGNSFAQPTANLLLTQVVSPRRLGVAMGLKQCYIPLASLLGGIAVPTVALVFGWRWAIAGAAVICGLITAWGLTAGERPRTTPETRFSATAGDTPSGLPRAGLVILAAGGGLASAAATALGIFVVTSGVAAGISPGAAGYLLAFCSALIVISRVLLGWLADRRPGRSPYGLVANLMLGSVVGYILLAVGGREVFVAGAIVAYLGWTWAGLLHLGIVRDSIGSVARSTGVLQTGMALGAALGPLTLGFVAEAESFRAAWLVTAVIGLAAAIVTQIGRHIVTVSQEALV